MRVITYSGQLKQLADSVDEARRTLDVADEVVKSTVRIMVGRLRVLNGSDQCHDTLRRLKRELRDYNVNTRRWREDEGL